VEVVIATRNPKKGEELRRMLHGAPLSILTLERFPGCPDVAEEGESFEANALRKAVAVARFTGKAALADDSGLEVEALGGAPGVGSARYAGEGADDRRNLQKLLDALRDVPPERRGARYVCCLALAFPDGRTVTFSGTVEGRIGTEPRGARGFGYDPVFYPEGHARTFAEMGDDEKDAISHRGRALREVARFLDGRGPLQGRAMSEARG